MVTTDELLKLSEATDFSGVIRRERNGKLIDEFARGLADRRHEVMNTVATRFGVASATKGLTALTVMALVEAGEVSLATTLRSVVGDDLPMVDSEVTIEHLLSHRSGVGDYLDEETLGDIDDFVLDLPVHTLERPSDYLPLLSPHPQVSPPGNRFAYNNSGYMMLSLMIERLAGSFHDAVAEAVLGPAGMSDAGFFRSDDLPPNTAVGYREDGRSNIFNLPVIGAGDGGIYLSLNDVSALWAALLDERIVSEEAVIAMTTPRQIDDKGLGYGLGFWLRDDGNVVMLEGMDCGVSFKSLYDRRSAESYTAVSNTSSGVWPFEKLIEGRS